MRWSLVLLALMACPKRKPILYDGGTVVMPGPQPPVLPSDPAPLVTVEGDLVLACVLKGGPVLGECAEPLPCVDGLCPELQALAVGVQPLAAGMVSLPMGTVSVTYEQDSCGLVATSTEPGVRLWEPGRAITPVSLVDAAAYGPEGFVATAAFAVDLDGDAVDEWIVDGAVGEDAVVGVVSGDSWAEVFYDDGWSATLLGLTDASLDGDLELVFSGSGQEMWGTTVGSVSTGRFTVSGSAGCAY